MSLVENSVNFIGGGAKSLFSYSWIFLLLLGASIFLLVLWMWKKNRDNNKSWTHKIRVWNQDPNTNRVRPNFTVVLAKRMQLPNGIRVFFLKNSILGYNLLPELTDYTEPMLYDIILTPDQRIFMFEGFKIADFQKARDEIGVGINYPAIDLDFRSMNIEYKEMAQQVKKSDFSEIIKTASWVLIAILITASIFYMGGKWVEESGHRAERAKAEAAISENMITVCENTIANTNGMNILIDKLSGISNSNINNNRLVEI